MFFRTYKLPFLPIFLYLSFKEDYAKTLLKGLFPTIILLNLEFRVLLNLYLVLFKFCTQRVFKLYFDGCRLRRRGRRRRRGRGSGGGWRGSWRTWSTSTPDSGRLSRNLSKRTIARERTTLSKSH
jgi:hypothetical protein